jgi:hypothetical protein
MEAAPVEIQRLRYQNGDHYFLPHLARAVLIDRSFLLRYCVVAAFFIFLINIIGVIS